MELVFDVSTDWGVFALGVTQKGLSSVFFPGEHANAALMSGRTILHDDSALIAGYAKSASQELRAYVEGRSSRPFAPMDFTSLSSFRLDVYQTLMEIPFGQTISYQKLAFLSGHPCAARAVGTAMKKNRTPLFVPCHRVIAAANTIGGWSGPRGMKNKILAHEGVLF